MRRTRSSTPGAPRRTAARRTGWTAALLAGTVLATVAALTAPANAAPAARPAPTHPAVAVDPQHWTEQADMTWDDYVDVRPAQWSSAATSQGSEVQYRTAVLLVEFTDQPMLITQEPGTHPFGNPYGEDFEPVPEDQVRDWYQDYYTVPNQYNGHQTLHSYWMEDSFGKIGVDAEVFGAYELPGKLHEYGINDQMNGPVEKFCPMGDECGKDLRTDATARWRDAIGCTTADFCGFDNIFIVTAGHDESSTWEEFGRMKYASKEDVPDALGPPRDENGDPVLNQLGEPMTNWARTRYVDWTSWRAAANHWPNAGGGISTQAESSGLSVFAHEFSHLRNLPDNYNNPFADDTRNYTGYWEMMSRGTFNGPGGTHNRWQVPNRGGSALGPHHMVHYKQALGVLGEDETVRLTKAALREHGVAVATLRAREYAPGEGDRIALDVDVDGFALGACEDQMARAGEPDTAFWCPDGQGWQDYTMEVVDRVGNDSFAPGAGVLLSQNRSQGTPREWLVDANPRDIARVDYVGPTGEDVMVVRGDPRQLDDATFHAGTGSGSAYEWTDEPNGLHFYVLDVRRDADGVLTYQVAVRALDAAGPQERGTRLGRAAALPAGGSTALVGAPLTNTGDAGRGMHASDVYRLKATVEGEGWKVDLPYEVQAVRAGSTLPVAAYATASEGAARRATVTITATSESDPSATSTTTVRLSTAALAVSTRSLRALLDGYAEQGVLSGGEVARLSAQLRQAERHQHTEKALKRFALLAGKMSTEGRRALASAALVSAARTLAASA
ncbi:M6 family metalloprotease domain-containing protein [Streptomyces sp. NPDC093065]|uniref:M6 family metalloprotease domain-containing protein n=1 Tax=Streptomyces sp. NPDC093065 TaxID=3366021 RepID=UPI00382693B2